MTRDEYMGWVRHLSTEQLLSILKGHREQYRDRGRRPTARKAIAAIKDELTQRGETYTSGPEPCETLADVLALFPEP